MKGRVQDLWAERAALGSRGRAEYRPSSWEEVGIAEGSKEFWKQDFRTLNGPAAVRKMSLTTI